MLYKVDKKELKQKIKINTLNISQSINKSSILNLDFLSIIINIELLLVQFYLSQ